MARPSAGKMGPDIRQLYKKRWNIIQLTRLDEKIATNDVSSQKESLC